MDVDFYMYMQHKCHKLGEVWKTKIFKRLEKGLEVAQGLRLQRELQRTQVWFPRQGASRLPGTTASGIGYLCLAFKDNHSYGCVHTRAHLCMHAHAKLEVKSIFKKIGGKRPIMLVCLNTDIFISILLSTFYKFVGKHGWFQYTFIVVLTLNSERYVRKDSKINWVIKCNIYVCVSTHIIHITTQIIHTCTHVHTHTLVRPLGSCAYHIKRTPILHLHCPPNTFFGKDCTCMQMSKILAVLEPYGRTYLETEFPSTGEWFNK